MTPADYMTEIVLPTIYEFRKDRRSRRYAYLACITLFHVKDHLRKAGVMKIENTIRELCDSQFEIVRSVCNGAKHLETNRSHRIPFKAGDDTDRPPAVWGAGKFGMSRWGDPVGGLEVEHEGTRHDVYACVATVARVYCDTYDCLTSCDLRDLEG